MRPESGYSWVRYGLPVASVASSPLVGLAIGPALSEGPPLALLLAAVILAAESGNGDVARSAREPTCQPRTRAERLN